MFIGLALLIFIGISRIVAEASLEQALTKWRPHDERIL